jgi:hypothetical protein
MTLQKMHGSFYSTMHFKELMLKYFSCNRKRYNPKALC